MQFVCFVYVDKILKLATLLKSPFWRSDFWKIENNLWFPGSLARPAPNLATSSSLHLLASRFPSCPLSFLLPSYFLSTSFLFPFYFHFLASKVPCKALVCISSHFYPSANPQNNNQLSRAISLRQPASSSTTDLLVELQECSGETFNLATLGKLMKEMALLAEHVH